MKLTGLLLVGSLALPGSGPAPSIQNPLDEAQALIEARKYEEVAAVLAAVLGKNPDDPRANHLLGRTHLELGDYDKACLHLERAAQFEPQNVESHLWLARAYGQKARTANIFSAVRWASKWKAELETAHRIEPRNTKARDHLIQFLVNAPAIGGGDKKRARDLAEDTIGIDETQGRLLLASVFKQTGQTDQAVAEYEKALQRDPANTRAHMALGHIFLGQSNYSAAEAHLRKYAEAAPDEPSAHDNLGDLHAALGEMEKAIAEYGKAIEMDRRFSTARFNLAKAYEQEGSIDEAIRQYELLLAITPLHGRAEEARKRLDALRKEAARRQERAG